MTSRLLYLTLILGVMLISCNKDAEIQTSNYPIVETMHASNINSNGVTFNAKVITRSSDPILQYGFIYRNNHGVQDIIVAEGNFEKDEFSTTLNNGFTAGYKYQFWSFVKTETDTVIGNEQEFLSKGSLF